MSQKLHKRLRQAARKVITDKVVDEVAKIKEDLKKQKFLVRKYQFLAGLCAVGVIALAGYIGLRG